MGFLDVLGIKDAGPVFTNPRLIVELDQRGETFAYGGLALAHELVGRLKLPALLDNNVKVFERHRPYHESDHILTHVYNLYVGGGAIEDIANLQGSKAFQNLVGAESVPDPSTAGDFLRRFDANDLGSFQSAIDQARAKVWKRLPRKQRLCLTVDMDSTIKEVYGQCKQGADFSYTGKWSYHPLVISTAETKECLRLLNRPGNSGSADGAAAALEDCLRPASRYFKKLRVRGDSAFYQHATIKVAEAYGAEFAFVMDTCPAVRNLAAALPEKAWRPFKAAPPPPRKKMATVRRRRKRERLRRKKARERGYRTLSTVKEWVGEIRYTPSFAKKEYRVVVKRQLIEESHGQQALIRRHEYRFIITSNEHDCPAEVVRFAYGRCDQENTIEQLKNGIAAMRMPTGELLANAAFMLAAELAWNLRAWLSLLALPKATGTWEWKRFRHAFVYVSAKVVRSARGAVARIGASHRFAGELLDAVPRVRQYGFG
jgi:hypothetical protein